MRTAVMRATILTALRHLGPVGRTRGDDEAKIRISKFEARSKSKQPCFEIRICFGLRISNFEFHADLPLRWNSLQSRGVKSLPSLLCSLLVTNLTSGCATEPTASTVPAYHEATQHAMAASQP